MVFDDPFHPFTDPEFEKQALALFKYQFENNDVYHSFCTGVKITPDKVKSIHQIPFLPISFFKTHEVKTTPFIPEIVFRSSGTTGSETSRHFIKSLSLYQKAYYSSFQFFYGDPYSYTFLALLPNYLERDDSSLIYMMTDLVQNSASEDSGFYLYNHEDLYQKLIKLKENGQKTILFGVTFALLDFVEHFSIDFPDLIVFETGGMKGRRKEMVKEEVHTILTQKLGVPKIHSEYGMCELLSQAYSSGDNLFNTPPWMKLLLRDEKEPIPSLIDSSFKYTEPTTGAIQVIDFANLYSCAFIATEDLGRRHPNGAIEIIGRLDSARLRGCNLMVI
ncbi:MAG: acyl transferase [Bacteroidetes bacterium]|nr:acyl transferase [Bacteroidota bacterium]